MSNTDFSHVNLAVQKSAQTQFAGFVQTAGDAARTPGLVRIGGSKDASVAILTNSGSVAAGATKVGGTQPIQATSRTVTTYNLAKTILAANTQS